MGLRRADYLIVSCEHGGNRVPSAFKTLFSEKFLASHRGYDAGALALARDLAAAARAPLFYSTTSRLLVELNRPLGHPQIFHRPFPERTRAAMRERFSARRYVGVQIEVNQKFPRGGAARWRTLRANLVASLMHLQ